MVKVKFLLIFGGNANCHVHLCACCHPPIIVFEVEKGKGKETSDRWHFLWLATDIVSPVLAVCTGEVSTPTSSFNFCTFRAHSSHPVPDPKKRWKGSSLGKQPLVGSQVVPSAASSSSVVW